MAGLARALGVAGGPTILALVAAGCTSRALAVDAGSMATSPSAPTDAATAPPPATDASQSAADASRPAADTGDAGTAAMPLQSTVTPAGGMPDAIAIDDQGVYWTTTTNGVWMLDAAAASPRRLAVDDPEGEGYCDAAGRLAVGETQVFWRSAESATLRRAAKDGSGQAILADHLSYTIAPAVRTDGSRVYWSDGDGKAAPNIGGPGAVIQALPQDAGPGTTPSVVASVDWILEVADVAVSDDVLYYETLPTTGTTVFVPSLQKVDLGAGAQTQATPAVPGLAGSCPRPHDGDLYFVHYIGLHASALAVLRAGADQATDVAPIDEYGADEIVPFENWILISVPSGSCDDRQHRLVAVPTTPDRPTVQLAADMGTTAVMGAYLAYGDLAGNIHLSTPDQVRAALASATR